MRAADYLLEHGDDAPRVLQALGPRLTLAPGSQPHAHRPEGDAERGGGDPEGDEHLDQREAPGSGRAHVSGAVRNVARVTAAPRLQRTVTVSDRSRALGPAVGRSASGVPTVATRRSHE